jgi:hypothetical protein
MERTVNGLLRGVRDRLRREAFRAHYELRWRVTANRASARRFREQRPSLNDVQRRLVHDLCVLGIAFARFDELGIDPEDWEQLSQTSSRFAHSAQVAHAMREYPAVAASPPSTDAYLVKLYPQQPTFAPSSPLLHVGLAPAVLDTVNGYLGMWSKLIYADMWHSIPVDVGRRIGSQRWHRDPEDRRMVKIYLYFSDVHAGAGAMEYVPGSCTTGAGRYRDLWPWQPRGARYPPDEDFDRRVPASDRLACLGPPGTIIFCDTDGFHRGGIATTGVRLVATWTFVTPASISMVSSRRFVVADPDGTPAPLSDAARFAIT